MPAVQLPSSSATVQNLAPAARQMAPAWAKFSRRGRLRRRTRRGDGAELGGVDAVQHAESDEQLEQLGAVHLSGLLLKGSGWNDVVCVYLRGPRRFNAATTRGAEENGWRNVVNGPSAKRELKIGYQRQFP